MDRNGRVVGSMAEISRVVTSQGGVGERPQALFGLWVSGIYQGKDHLGRFTGVALTAPAKPRTPLRAALLIHPVLDLVSPPGS